jgi:ADP-dependent NAD(P)H-hydrate dehydratase / NAD(P)H-hydrate epimerase
VPVVAIDVPSGIDGLTGAVRGAAVKADLTVTFFRMKPGHVVEPGRTHCGEIVVAEIGLPEEVTSLLPQRLWINEKPVLPLVTHDQHKYSRGGAVIWSGDALHSGAARLAAQAAQRSGAGIVCLAGPKDGLIMQAQHVTSIVLHEVQSSGELEHLLGGSKYRACCIGPAAGVTEAMWRMVMAALASAKPVVLDADALTLFAQHRDIALRMTNQQQKVHVVMTPHEGEFARMFPELVSEPSRLHRAQAAAQVSGTVIVLKGEGTIIAHPDGRAVIQTQAPAKLATAGSGDVLAGLIAGLMAQEMAPFEAACAGVWLHTEAARSLPRSVVIAEDLVAALAR